MEKMTYVSCINDVLNGVALTDEHIEKLKALSTSLEKRNTKSDKPTKNQLANERLQMDIYDSMSVGYKYTISEMLKMFPCLSGLSTQKVTPQMVVLCEKGLVAQTVEKRKSYYTKVVVE